MPAAHEVTVLETLALLDDEHSGLAQGVTRREYALWLGSGISLDRIVGVRGVIARVLDYLRERIDPADANCRHRRALEEILEELTDPERALVELDKPVAEWPEASARAVLGRLAGRYSQVLNTHLDGEQDEDFLLWTAVDIPNCFTSEDPDVEHLCIVMLAMEGVFTDVSSANWDYLIEAAERDLAGPGALLDICIRANDFQAAAAPAKLLKFHGCAVRAVNDAPYVPAATDRPATPDRQLPQQPELWRHASPSPRTDPPAQDPHDRLFGARCRRPADVRRCAGQ